MFNYLTISYKSLEAQSVATTVEYVRDAVTE